MKRGLGGWGGLVQGPRVGREQEALPGLPVPPSGSDKVHLPKCPALPLTNLSGCPSLDT